MTKYYVVSGELQHIIRANTPYEAAEKAIEKGKGETIDGMYFFVDERGMRTDNAAHKVPVDDVMETMGFECEDDDGEYV